VAILQVKSVPDELYAALGERAKREGISMSELVIRTLKKELAKPTMAEWVERVRSRSAAVAPVGADHRDSDVVATLDEVRAEFDVHWDRLFGIGEQDSDE